MIRISAILFLSSFYLLSPFFPKEDTDDLLIEVNHFSQKIKSQLEGEERLDAFHKLQQRHLYKKGDSIYNELMLNEAIRQDNYKYQAIALTNRVAYNYRNYKSDTIFHLARQAEAFCKKHDQMKNYYLVKQMIVQRYLNQGQYSMGIKKAMELKDEAKLTDDIEIQIIVNTVFANLYIAIEREEEAVEHLNYILSLDYESVEAPYKKLECYVLLLHLYKVLGNFEKIEYYTDILVEEINRLEILYPKFGTVDSKMRAIYFSAYVHIKKGEFDLAQSEINRFETFSAEVYCSYFQYCLNLIKFYYYLEIKDRKQSNYYYDIVYNYCKDNNMDMEMRDLLKYRAHTLSQQGYYKDATGVYNELVSTLDSITQARYLYNYNLIHLDYELEARKNHITQQQDKLESSTRFSLWLAILTCCLLVTLCYIWVIASEKRKKNRILFSKIKELSRTKSELLEFKTTVQNKYFKEGKEGAEPGYGLFERLEDFMNREKPFINSDYGRKSLIADMNTNEVYLAKAIRDAVDMTILDYIYHWRMEYAKTLLLESKDLTIEAVAMDSGFTSIRNFYRLFKETYGMTPAYFRTYVKES